ncbi:Uncharacterised protein [uncultured archaeon]|nr:Uncharacterised protein [uncultured archaeon]
MKEKILGFKIEWGKISFDGSSLRDIIFAEGKVAERDYERIRAKYETSHVVDEIEARLLLKGNPAEVIIGTGFSGMIKLTPEAESILKQKTALIVMLSPQAIDLLNDKLKRNIRVNALIHTTC